jgi:serine/threonine protein kinase
MLAAPSALCGSPAYMAPEVVAADAAHLASRRFAAFDGRRADAWSAGVLLYEAACHAPFRPPAKALDPLAEVAALHGAWVRARGSSGSD